MLGFHCSSKLRHTKRNHQGCLERGQSTPQHRRGLLRYLVTSRWFFSKRYSSEIFTTAHTGGRPMPYVMSSLYFHRYNMRNFLINSISFLRVLRCPVTPPRGYHRPNSLYHTLCNTIQYFGTIMIHWQLARRTIVLSRCTSKSQTVSLFNRGNFLITFYCKYPIYPANQYRLQFGAPIHNCIARSLIKRYVVLRKQI